MCHSRSRRLTTRCGTRASCGSCVIASQERFFWLGVSGVASQKDLAGLLNEVQQAIVVPVRGIISDGQHAIRDAVHAVFPDVTRQLCHFHYFREAAKPVYEADRYAKKELKKHLRGVRPIERSLSNEMMRWQRLSMIIAKLDFLHITRQKRASR